MKAERIDSRPCVKIVTANELITADGLKMLNPFSRKILYTAIAQSQIYDTGFKRYYISNQEFADLAKTDKANISRVKTQIAEELSSLVLVTYPKARNGKATYHNAFHDIVPEDEGGFSFQLHDHMKDLILGLKRNFTQTDLLMMIGLHGKYSMPIWHLMQREMHGKRPKYGAPITFFLSLEEIGKVVTIPESYKISDVKKRILDPVIAEIDKTMGIQITYSDVKRGKKVIGMNFTAESYKSLTITFEELSDKGKLMVRKAELIRKQVDGELTQEEFKELQNVVRELEQMRLEERSHGEH